MTGFRNRTTIATGGAGRCLLLVLWAGICFAQVAPKGYRFYEQQPVGSALAREVAVGKGNVWAIGSEPRGNGNYNVMHLVGTEWQTVNGMALRIAVDGTGTPWIVNAQREIYRFNSVTPGWDRVPGAATEIAAGGDHVWILGGVTRGENNSISRWNGRNWVAVPGLGAKLSVSSSGTAYLVTKSGELWQFSQPAAANPWVKLASGVNQISASTNPAGASGQDILLITTTHDRIETKSNGTWYGSTSPLSETGPPALRIARDDSTTLRAYAILADPVTQPAGRVVIGDPSETDINAGPVLARDSLNPQPALGFWVPGVEGVTVFADPGGQPWLAAVGTNWMSFLPDSTPLHKLSIPGTHDSGSRLTLIPISLCQTMTDREQLDVGIRYFDYRTRNTANGLDIYHTVDQFLSFDAVLKAFDEFLTAHPTEVVIMRVSKDAGDQAQFPSSSVRWSELKAKYGRIYSNVNTMTPRPTLGALRGKILFLGGDAYGDPSNNLRFPPRGESADFFLQDAYDLVLPSETGDGIVTANPHQKAILIGEAFNKAAEPANNKLVLNHVSGTGIANIYIPILWALAINPLVYSNLPEKKVVLGTAIMDFPGGSLIGRILRTNFRFE